MGCLFLVATSAVAADVLFPSPLHLTRELTDPITGTKTVLDEYCHGNRVVSVSGRRTAIAEYDKGVLTTIDFEAGTYSVTKFEELARAWSKGPGLGETAAALRADDANAWRVESRGGKVVASRPGETIEAERKDAQSRQLIRVTADRQLVLSRNAVEVLMGHAYPHRPDPASGVVVNALRSKERNADYFLPLEHLVEHELDGEKIEVRNVVLRVGNELPPPDVLAVPPGAKLVESKDVAVRRLLEELDGRPLQ